MAPLRYVAQWRMQLSERLLVETDESLASIAARVGYESEFAFSRAFKRHRSVAPGAFRRAHRAAPGATPTRAAA
jgi:AraC-like DNA-binding protein